MEEPLGKRRAASVPGDTELGPCTQTAQTLGPGSLLPPRSVSCAWQGATSDPSPVCSDPAARPTHCPHPSESQKLGDGKERGVRALTSGCVLTSSRGGMQASPPDWSATRECDPGCSRGRGPLPIIPQLAASGLGTWRDGRPLPRCYCE